MQYLYYADIQPLKTYDESWVQENNNVQLCIVLKDGGSISVTLSLLTKSFLFIESTLGVKFCRTVELNLMDKDFILPLGYCSIEASFKVSHLHQINVKVVCKYVLFKKILFIKVREFLHNSTFFLIHFFY